MAVKQRGLGKGLEALFLDNTTEVGSITNLRLSEVEPNKDQPRRLFDEAALRELADSIRAHGIIQPLVVRPLDSGGYQIVAGERRWRAARMAGLSEVPVVIRELGDHQTLEIAIIENLQREDLNVIELAAGYQMLMDQYNMTQEQIADKVGKSRPAVANTIRLLNLPEPVLEQVRAGKIPRGHAKALLSLEDEDLITDVAKQIVSDSVLVRDIEKMARERKQEIESGAPRKKAEKEPRETGFGGTYFKEMELALAAELGRKVRIISKENKAILEVEFYSNDELNDLAQRLTGKN